MQTEGRSCGIGPIASIERVRSFLTRTLPSCLGLLVALLIFILAPHTAVAAECTTTWTGPSSGTWHTGANWSTGKVPTSEDVACIGSGSTAEITTSSQVAAEVQGEGGLKITGGSLGLMRPGSEGTSTVNSLAMSNGTLTGPGTLNVTSSFAMTGTKSVTMSGGGKTVLKPGSTSEINSTNTLLLNERTFVNEGTLTFASGVIEMPKSVIENIGTFKANSQSGNPEIRPGIWASTFVNNGVFEKTAGSGKTTVGVKFENNGGSVEAKSGDIGFSNGGSSSGTNSLTAAEGKKIIFAFTGNWTLGSSTSYAGNFELTGANVTAGGGFQIPGDTLFVSSGQLTVSSGLLKAATLSMSGGTVKLEGEPSTVNSLAMSNGTLTGPGTLNVTSSFAMTGTKSVTMSGGGKTVLKPGSTSEINSTNTLLLNERTFVNEGTLTFASGVIEMPKSVIENIGTFKANSQSGNPEIRPGIWASTFVNNGVFEKTAGSGKTTVGVKFENNGGSVEAKSGDIGFSNGGSSSGTNSLTAAEGKKIIFAFTGNWTLGSSTSYAGNFELTGANVTAGGGFQIPGDTLFVSSGQLTVSSGLLKAATLSMSGGTVKLEGEPSTVNSLAMSNGTLTGPGTLNVTSSFAMTGTKSVTMSGGGKTVLKPGSTSEINSTNTLLLNERTFVNEGTLTFASGVIEMPKSVIENIGTFKANSQSGNPEIRPGIWASTFVNNGVFEKTAGSGKTTVGVKFENNGGSVEAKSGDIGFSNGGSSSGTNSLTAAEGKKIIFAFTGNWTIGPSTSFSGVFEFTGASVTVSNGLSLLPAGTLNVISGQLTIASGALEADTLSMSGGTVKLEGEPSTVNSLAMSNGTLTGPGTLNVTSSFAMTGTKSVTMSGGGKTVLKPGSTSEINSTNTLLLNERTFVNEGTLTFASGVIEMPKSVIENIGTFKANSQSGNPEIRPGIWASTFVNNGVFEKTAGSGKTTVGVKFENNGGSVEAKSGDIGFSNGGAGNSANSFTTGEGNKIIFAFTGEFAMGSGTFYSGNFEITGAKLSTSNGMNNAKGTLTIQSGSYFTDDPLEVKTLTMHSGTAHLDGEPSTVNSLTMTDGTLKGPADLNVTSSFALTGTKSVDMSGVGGTILKPNATSEINTTNDLALTERTLINEGTLTFAQGRIEGIKGAFIENKGTFKANSESSFPQILPGTGEAPLILNEGTFEKTAGTGKTQVDINFANFGKIGEKTGKLVIKNPVKVDRNQKFGKRSTCGDPVDCATGNFFETQTDIAVGGRGIGLMLARSYSARSAAVASSPGAFGYGWTNSFGDRLVAEEEGKRVTLIRGNGTTVPFTGGPGTFTAPTWSQETLSGNAEAGYALTLADQTLYEFSGSGRLTDVIDRNGNKTTLGYDGSGRLKTITDPSARQIVLTYNGEGLIEGAEDPMGHVIEYAYESKHLKSVTLPGEEEPRWQFKYDGSHRITEMTDGRGGKTTNEYDADSRVISQTNPAGQTLKFVYEPFHTTVTNEATGTVTDQWFTSNNQPYSITYGYGTEQARTETFAYDSAGRLLSQTDPASRKTTYGYNAAGDRTSMKDPAGNETKWTYNATHDVIAQTTPGGLTTTLTRDEQGNVESLSRPAPSESNQTFSFAHAENGDLEGVTNPLGKTWSFEYNAQGDRVAETSPEGDTGTWTYNANSQVIASVSPRGNEEGAEASEFTTTTELDAIGRPIKVTDPLGHAVEYAYDGNGNLETLTNANGHTTTYFYDPLDQLVKVEKPNSDLTETGYNGEGQVTSQTDGNEETTTYVRNILGQVTKVIDPLGREKIYAYDLAGNLVTATDAAERETSYTYDLADRVTDIDYSSEGTPDVSFEYDADGNVLEMVDGTGESSFEYDILGRLVAAEDGHGDQVEYQYDLANQQTAITYPNGKSVLRSFDGAGQLESVTDWLGGTTSFSYDADSHLAETVFPESTGSKDEFAYDAAGFMEEAAFKQESEVLGAVNYARDSAAQIEATVTQGLPGTEEQEFDYDKNGRLSESSAGSYEFDAADNLIKTPTSTNAYDAAGQLEEGGGVAYTYNVLGERTKATPSSGPATTYAYDQAGGLMSITRPEEGEAAAINESFTYDGSRLAASHTVGESVSYLTWDTSRKMPALLSDGTRSFIYGPGGVPIAHIDTGETPTYYHHDQLGSTRMLSNEAGEAIGSFSYTPYGEVEASSGSANTPIGYAAQYTASGTGLQYLRARQYDPLTAQFLTKDPLAELTREPYAYGGGNPLTYVDPTGLGLCIGGIIDCDEDDDPCDKVLGQGLLCLVPIGSQDDVVNTAAGAADSILSPIPGTDPGPWLRDQLGIPGVDMCSAAYRFARGATDLVTAMRNIARGADWAGRRLPDVYDWGRRTARKQNERIVHLPSEIMQ